MSTTAARHNNPFAAETVRTEQQNIADALFRATGNEAFASYYAAETMQVAARVFGLPHDETRNDGLVNIRFALTVLRVPARRTWRTFWKAPTLLVSLRDLESLEPMLDDILASIRALGIVHEGLVDWHAHPAWVCLALRAGQTGYEAADAFEALFREELDDARFEEEHK